MKTKIRKHLLSAVLLMGTALMMTACGVAEQDNAVWSNPLGEKIHGLWYVDYQASGTVDVPPQPIRYNRVVEAIQFKDDGTGT